MIMVLLKELQRSIGEPESLARFGFNPKERISSLKDFSLQMESHALHVIEDRPVSNAYSYFIDREQIYIDEKRETKLFVDPQERDGLALLGVEEVVEKACFNPGQIVFLYSPPGPVVFRSGTRYDKMKPYPDGQLYLLVGTDNNRVDTLAISVSKEEEKKTLSTFLGSENSKVGFDDGIEKIKYFLTQPIITNWNIDDFLVYLEGISYLNDFSVYKNVHKEEFKLSDVLSDLRRGWIGEIKPKITIHYQQLFNIAQRGNVRGAYLNQLQNYFPLYSKNGVMPLGGGCGGDDVDTNEFDPLKEFKQTNLLSTNYRLRTPSIQDILKKKDDKDFDEYGSLKFDCPICNGEHTRPRHKLLEKCPTKGKEIPKC
jgi:hypothetical protein